MPPIISVIIPVFEVEQYLPKCIESILSQTFTDFEVILINDGSRDNSGKICEEYAVIDNRVRVFHKKNGGVSSSRNLGINYAKGKWITFVDSDDWVDKVTYQEILSSIENKNVDLVLWGFKLVTLNHIKEVSVPMAGLFNTKSSIDELLIQSDLQGYFGSSWNKLYSSRLIKMNNLSFDISISLMEDSKFNYSYFEFVSSVFAIQKSYYNYRVVRNQLSLSKTYPDNYLEIWKEHTNMRSEFYSSYKGFYKDKFNMLLKKEIEMSHLALIFAFYNERFSTQKRKDGFKRFIARGNFNVLQGSYMYNILQTNNVFFIDAVFKIRHMIIKYFPGALRLMLRVTKK